MGGLGLAPLLVLAAVHATGADMPGGRRSEPPPLRWPQDPTGRSGAGLPGHVGCPFRLAQQCGRPSRQNRLRPGVRRVTGGADVPTDHEVGTDHGGSQSSHEFLAPAAVVTGRLR
jgi:hypothetical protein